jgi:GWxTD domain-containing protein
MLRNLPIVLTALLAACPLPAAGLSRELKDWAKSPQAYFLTSQERAEWKTIQDDAQARDFISRYLARRGPDFRATLTERIGVADKYFSAGKIRGSETLRGKVIIVFGPPSQILQSDSRGSMGRPGTVDRGEVTSGIPDPHSNVGPGVAGLSRSEQDAVFSILYDEKHAPRCIGKAIRVDLKMKSDARQEAVRPEELEEWFEAVAKASIKPSS